LEPAALEALLGELGREAREYRFEVAPNPCVGAAVLSDGRVIARGYHREWGGPHAEVNAFEAAARSGVPREEWDTLVVTLEPCSSCGKTCPCVEAIEEAGIQTVVAGSLDPDPRHRGAGLERMREVGIEVILLEGAAHLEEISPYFLDWISYERLRRPRPWTIAKWAQTLTGQLSPPEDVGEGRWISCADALEEVHRLRARVDAIVTGVGTVLADDPRLTVRSPASTEAPPARVVLDSVLRTPPGARLFVPPANGEAGGTVHLLSQLAADDSRSAALTHAGAQVQGLRGDDRRTLNLRELQTWLWEQGYQRVLIEAGPTLIGAFLDAGFVDQLRVYTGSVRGGRGEGLGARIASLSMQGRLDREVGGDQVLEAFLETG